LNAFLTLPYSKITEGVFRKEAVPYLVEGEELVIYGNEAARFASLTGRDTRRPMTRGLLNPNEPNSVAMISRIAASLAGEKPQKGAHLCFSVPGAPRESADDLKYHETTLRQVFGEMGYRVSSVNEGLAVVLAELSATNYTGIGISFGGGMCNVCLAYLSVPVFNFSIAKAGDYIDASAASVAGDQPTRIRLLKEDTFHFNGRFADKILQALAVYYDDVIHAVAQGLKDAFVEAGQLPRFDRPIPLVISGGTALPRGFRDRFEKVLSEAKLPVALSEVRMAADPLHTTAKGALIAAQAEL
jgi:hypothetical protein